MKGRPWHAACTLKGHDEHGDPVHDTHQGPSSPTGKCEGPAYMRPLRPRAASDRRVPRTGLQLGEICPQILDQNGSPPPALRRWEHPLYLQ